MIIIIATFGQALAGNAHGVNIFGVLIVWRFIMGVGIGGDYPLSAVISSEFASTRIRGRLMTAVFAFQGWGNFTAALIALIITSAFKSALLADDPKVLAHVDNMWRILIGLGCVPGVVALYYRLTIPETPRFTMDIERNVQQASDDVDNFLATGTFYVDPDAVIQRVDAPKASRSDFAKHFSQWRNLKILIGCAWSWFALDIAFYGLGLNSSIVLTAIGFSGSSATGTLKVYESLKNIAIGNLILSAAGLIPGYWVTFLFIDSWGRKPIQLMGFTVLTVLFIIMGFAYDKLIATTATRGAFVFLYCLANFFQNFGTYPLLPQPNHRGSCSFKWLHCTLVSALHHTFLFGAYLELTHPIGPNTTTFVIPGEAFPTRYRSTSHGISAASGKLGAIVAQVGFAQLKDIGGTNQFVKHILEIFALFMLTGIFSTLLLPETKGRTLEELSNEDQEDFVKGVAKSEVKKAPKLITHS